MRDISCDSSRKFPLFEGTEAIFGDLLSAPLDTKISKELPELTLEFIGVLLINQTKVHKKLEDAITFFEGVVAIALMLFSINLTIHIVRLIFSMHRSVCTSEHHRMRRINQSHEQLNVWAEIVPLALQLAQLANHANH